MGKKKTEEKKTVTRTPILHSKEKGSPFYEENRVEGERIDDSKYLKWCYKAIDLFKEGVSRELIVDMLSEEAKGKITWDEVNNVVVVRARQIISLEYEKNDKFVLGLHLQRYSDEIAKQYKNITKLAKNTKVKVWIRDQMIAGCYYTILDLMFHKEKILQLHNKKVTLKINQINNTVIRQKKPKFDLSKLTFEEKVKFLEYIEKMKRSNDEVFGVKLKKKEGEGDQIQEAEIVEEVNVEKIENFETPREEEKIEGNALNDAFEKLKQSLQKVAVEEFKRVGSKTVDGEGTV